MAKSSSNPKKPVRQAQLPSKFSPDYVAFVNVPLPDSFAKISQDIDRFALVEQISHVVTSGYRVTVERRPDGFYQAGLYGIDTGTAEDDGVGVSAGGHTALLALLGVLFKLSSSGVLSIHLKPENTERPPMW